MCRQKSSSLLNDQRSKIINIKMLLFTDLKGDDRHNIKIKILS